MNRVILSVIAAALALCLLAWLLSGSAPYAGLHEVMCDPGETVGACMREWFNPLAAIFTMAAIFYAARQVHEANRQSDAAVRASLAQLRDDTSTEVTNLERLIDSLERITVDWMLPADKWLKLDQAKVERIARKLLEVDIRDATRQIAAFSGAGDSDLVVMRNAARDHLNQHFVTQAEIRVHLEAIGLTDATVADERRKLLRPAIITLVRGIDNNVIVAYHRALLSHRDKIVHTIAEIDKDTLRRAELD